MTIENLSREESFLIQSCCINPSPERVETLDRLVTEQLDWHYIVNTSRLHGIAPLIYQAVSLCPSRVLVSADILQELKSEYHSTAFINLLFLREYQNILKHCNARNIDIMPLKGIALINDLYGNIALRSFSDIDILIKKHELERGIQVFKDLGYTRKKTDYSDEEHFHLIFQRETPKVTITVELHWDVDMPDSPFSVIVDDFWARSTAAAVDDLQYKRLSLEDSILFNCFHILRKPLSASMILLKNFCDIYELVTRYQTVIQWPVLMSTAEKYRVVRPVFLVLLILERYFAVPIPRTIGDLIKQQGFQEEMLNDIIHNKIFLKNTEKIFLPGMLTFPEQRKRYWEEFNFSSFFTTITYLVKCFKDLNTVSFFEGLKVVYIRFKRSLVNYARLFYLWLFDYKKIKALLSQMLRDKKKIDLIDQWIRN